MGLAIKKHFQNPRNVGEIKDAHGAGEAGSAECGAVIRVFIRFSDGIIADVSFQASGYSAVIAAGSILTEAITGKNWQHAAAFGVADLNDALFESLADDGALEENMPDIVIDNKMAAQAAQFGIEALHLAFEDSFRKDNFPRATESDVNTVVVAMSGGVDSSTACLLKKHEGREVIGITMRLADADGFVGDGFSCCSPRAIQEARYLCHSLGIPHLTLDFTDEFESVVVEDFLSEYLSGRTPNPCINCNATLRFPALIEIADRLGAARVATGHYARLSGNGADLRLSRGRDIRKDQSYMLAAINRELLPRLEFPLGGFEKKETREIARKGGISACDRPESQDTCFIPGNDYRSFLRQRRDFTAAEGDIVDAGGHKVGTHCGYFDFTVGQRRGLGLSAASPMYVLKTDPERNRVIVGGHDELQVRKIWIDKVNHMAPLGDLKDIAVQVRYNSEPASGAVINRDCAHWLIGLNEPVYGVAPGQTAVIYRGDEVIVSGFIVKTGP